jgi:hypothetical protein
MIGRLGTPLPAPILILEKLGVVAKYLALAIFGGGFLMGFGVAFVNGGADDLVLTLLFGLFIGIIAVPLAWEWMLHALADRLHTDLVDRLSGFGAHLLLGVVVLVIIVVPIALSAYADDLIGVRAKLVGIFSSRPPSRPGGPARCRHCDAPLDVPANALGVRCLFCSTDNLVAVTARAARKASKSAKHSMKAIDEAYSGEFSARYYLQARLKGIALLGVVLVPLFGGVGLLSELVMDEGGAIGHRTHAGAPPMLYRGGKTWAPGEVPLDCGDDACTFDVPLMDGQTLLAHGGDGIELQRRDVGPFYTLNWAGWTKASPGPVKHSGWYRLVVTASQPATLTWSVE